MNNAVILLVLCSVLVTVDSVSRIRYANSMPQFGSSSVNAYLPQTSLFTSVPGGFMTSYINITSKPWIFTSSYPTNVTALSNPTFLSNNVFYTLFTYQTSNSHLMNGAVNDLSSAPNSSVAYLRTVNVLQHNFNLDIYNISNNFLIFSNTQYASATEYKAVPPGDYTLYWTSSTSKRSTEGNTSSDPFLYGGSAYTYWILPTGSFIVLDGVVTVKRSATSKRSASLKTKMQVKDDLSTRNDDVNANVNANVNADVNDNNIKLDKRANRIQNDDQKGFVQSR